MHIDTTKKTDWASYVTRHLADIRNTTLLTVWLGSTLVFAGFYTWLYVTMPAHAPTIPLHLPLWRAFLDALYFSIITATSTGYGDIVPQGFAKAIASGQAIFSLSTFAILITKLVAHRQELALYEMHRIAFEQRFHNLCEELFITRKDVDRVIHAAEDQVLQKKDWHDLDIAKERCASLLEEIPQFYHADRLLYSIDEKRENLLAEATHRTLERFTQLQRTLVAKGVVIQHREKNVLRDAASQVLRTWQEKIGQTNIPLLKNARSLLGQLGAM